ncbi:MAG: hypothetical protein OEW67_07320 [Cyclobacteriaceae bacterium]|nr:hypothetical protein [Cyclobacteriaceae bacterium]
MNMGKIVNKLFTSILTALGVLVLFNSCYEIPSFPDTPSIGFDKVEFYDVSSGSDSLLITISFTDGNGDLGLSSDESDIKYRDVDYLFESADVNLTPDEVVTPRDVGRELTNFTGYPSSENINNLEFTKVPPYELPYSCTHWFIRPEIEGIEIQDTVFFIPNRNQFNIFVEFLYKDTPSAQFIDFDWVTDIPQPCGITIDGRFPILQKSGDGAAIEGYLKYGFVSYGLTPLFNDKILKLRIQIQDRALNKSNIVESPEFTLKEIQVN